jgi:beta-galactosidase
MVVMDENREFGDTRSGKANERTTTNDLSDLEQEVLRDRNHPSVIMWSLCNEEFAVQATPAGGRLAKALGAVVRKLDPTRPITAALNGGHGHSMSEALDLEGFNYNPSEYTGYHSAHSNALMFGSETASTTTTRGEYAVDKVHGYVPAYDTQGANTAEDAWQPIAERPYMAGAFVWTGFDYKGEPTPYGWPCVNSHFGIIDMCGFWKDVAHYYKAWWGDQPAVHVFPHWNWPGQEGKPIKVWAFGNGDSVELFLNGASLGRKPMPKYRHIEWDVPYAPGSLVAKCYSGDKLIATDKVETVGVPAALRVTTSSSDLKPDREDCAMLSVSVVDAQGRVVPSASNMVTFTTTGPAAVVGVGNGDPSCHEPDRATRRSTYHGLCLGVLQTQDRAGRVTVTVSSPGLRPATVAIGVAR